MSRSLPPVDDDVFAALQALAEPLVDDANAVLRRLLNLPASAPGTSVSTSGSANGDRTAPTSGVAAATGPPAKRTPSTAGDARSATRAKPKPKAKGKPKAKPKRPRAPRGALLPESEYELPILRYLDAHGGRAPSSEVVDAVGGELMDRLRPMDLETLESGDVRWRTRVQFVRLRLIEHGDMSKQAPRGMWEIADQGRARLGQSA